MQTPYSKYFKQHCHDGRGFTLIELMVVMTIVGILAIGVVFMFADPTAKVKAAAFEMRGDFNLARAESVRRNESILIDFIHTAEEGCSKVDKSSYDKCFSGTGSQQGYVICFDENGDNDCQNEVRTSQPATLAEVVEDLEDKIIKTVIFRNDVVFYDYSGTAPANGPTSDPLAKPLVGVSGLTFVGTTLTFNSNGTCDSAGSAVVYYPLPGSPNNIKGNPYAVIVDSISTGNVRLERWRGNDWFRK